MPRKAPIVLGSRLILVAGIAAAMTACSSSSVFYEIVDTSSGELYYTDEIERPKNDVYLDFENAKTNTDVHLTEFKVRTISRDRFEEKTKPVATADANSDG